jgi:transcriptional regulator with XRE-family HTH domain
LNDGTERVLTPSLIKAARALLGVDQAGLAELTSISRKTISLIEIANQDPTDPRRRKMLADLQRTMEDELGLEFIFASESTGEGVRLRKRRSVK